MTGPEDVLQSRFHETVISVRLRRRRGTKISSKFRMISEQWRRRQSALVLSRGRFSGRGREGHGGNLTRGLELSARRVWFMDRQSRNVSEET